MRNKPLLAVACLVIAAIVMIALLLRDDPAPPNALTPEPPAAVDAASASSSDLAQPRPDAARSEVQAAAAAATPDAPRGPGPTELWGRVVDVATQAGIANADVELQHRDADEFWNLDLKYGERVATLARAKSDADGRFRFDVERARLHRVHVTAPGYAAATVLHRTGGAEVLIELSRGAVVDGIVRCEGAGIADLDVRIAVHGESVELARGRTDGGGAFRFTGLPRATVWVQVSSPQFEEQWQRVELEPGKQHRVEIDLERGKTLRGRVVEATTGTPIVDAEVSDSWTFKRVVRTDVDGRFAIAGLKDQNFVMCHVRATGYASASRNVGGHLGDELEVRLVRGGEVTGRIVDAAGAPLGHAYAAVCASYREAAGMGGSDWIAAPVGRDGRFQALGLRTDQHYWLFVRCGGHGSRVYALARVLGSGERLDVGDVVLRAAGGIEGRVVDDAGAGMPGQPVSIHGTNSDSAAWVAGGVAPSEVIQFVQRSARTDGQGVFRFTSVAAGSYRVTVRRPGSHVEIAATVDVQDGARTDGVELVVPKGLTISGRIEYANGQAPGDELADVHLQAGAADGGSEYAARIGAGGTFHIEGAPAGEYTLTMFSTPKGWIMPPVRGVKAGATDVRVVLEQPAFVSGRVVDAQGKGVRASVWAAAEGVTSGSAMRSTDDEGRFRIEVAAAFRGSIGAALPGDWMQQAQVEGIVGGQSDVVITLKSR